MVGRGKEEEGYSVEAQENMTVALEQFKESLIPIHYDPLLAKIIISSDSVFFNPKSFNLIIMVRKSFLNSSKMYS